MKAAIILLLISCHSEPECYVCEVDHYGVGFAEFKKANTDYNMKHGKIKF